MNERRQLPIGQDLAGWRVEEWFQLKILSSDFDGQGMPSEVFFRTLKEREDVIEHFSSSHFCTESRTALVLTRDGKNGFSMKEVRWITVNGSLITPPALLNPGINVYDYDEEVLKKPTQSEVRIAVGIAITTFLFPISYAGIIATRVMGVESVFLRAGLVAVLSYLSLIGALSMPYSSEKLANYARWIMGMRISDN